MNNLILLATFWNEKDFVKASLEQIDRIDPVEGMICDGCFDPKKPLHSTDGTYEIIKEYIEKRQEQGKHARLINPQRKSFFKSFFLILRMNTKNNPLNMLRPSRWRILFNSINMHPYRLNQSITFNYMINKSKFWKPGRWFMTSDCDQFYSDEAIKSFEITGKNTKYGLLTAKEKTFFKDFDSYVDNYDKRVCNNMPHKIYRNTVIFPTRRIALEQFIRYRSYEDMVECMSVGTYFHYKLPKGGRFEKTYEVGDREKPIVESYPVKKFTGKHPLVIQKHFL